LKKAAEKSYLGPEKGKIIKMERKKGRSQNFHDGLSVLL
jgi:hypothetical protein